METAAFVLGPGIGSDLGLSSPDEPRADPESRVKDCKGVDEHAVDRASQAEGYEEERYQQPVPNGGEAEGVGVCATD